MSKVNYLEARRYYVHGGSDIKHIGKPNKATGKIEYPSLQTIADFYGVLLQTICKKSKAENWIDRRKQAQEEFDEKASKRLAELGIKSLTEVNAEHFKIGNLVIQRFLEQNQEKDKKGKPQKAQTIYAKDALGWAKLRQDISEKASNVDDGNEITVNVEHKVLSKEGKNELYDTLEKLRKLTKE